MLRTHTCGQLRADHIGQTVTLSGWVDTYRDHSGVLFIDLRDRYGKTQIVFAPEGGDDTLGAAKSLRSEDVIQIVGEVAPRPEGTINEKLATGQIEVRVRHLVVFNKTEPLPFQMADKFQEYGDDAGPSEDLRLRYRFLDLRRGEMQRSMLLRHRIAKAMRDYFDEHDFVEVETPMLGRSTPEGARDYLVPSRVSQGSFYALPQSPQIYKQLLMIAGYDRYVQIARCFRDEDLRADRQPEFTQLDVEMSFIEMDDIITVIDGLMARLAKDLLGIELSLPLPRMTYAEAMERFGHDAPDLRFGMEIVDITDLAKQVEFRVFRAVADGGGRIRGLNAKGAADKYSRKDIDELTAFVVDNFGAKGLAWFKVDADRALKSPIAKNFDETMLARIAERMEAQPGDMLLFLAGDYDMTCRGLNGLRRRLGAELKLYEPGQFSFSWVVEFPMFGHDEEEGGWTAVHHPFTAPLPEDVPLLESDPGRARAQAYDLVINGFEAGGGTIRIHDRAVQEKAFGVIGLEPDAAQERFGFLLDALKYGAPPHGGIALGLDRVVMLFGGLTNIRDCIAFPKTARASDLLSGAPSEVDPRQLRELALKIDRER